MGREITMKRYTKPTVEVVELSVRESLSSLPNGVNGIGRRYLSTENKRLAFVANEHTLVKSK